MTSPAATAPVTPPASRCDGGVGDGIDLDGRRWSFSGQAVDHFDRHVARSVPGYENGHRLVLELSDFFVLPGARVIDVGCSTGSLIAALAARHRSVDAQLVGVDLSSEMVDVAARRCRAEPRIRIEQRDATELDYTGASFVVLYYTLQFVPVWRRQEVLRRIHAGINPGGALVVFEKSLWDSGRMQSLGEQLYTSFKEAQGFAADEILRKAQSLRAVLSPLCSADNAAMIRDAGFEGPHLIYKFLAFEGLVAFRGR